MTTKWPSIDAIAKDVLKQKITATELVKESLRRIEDAAPYNSIISVAKDRALKRAADIDKRIKNGQPVGKLAGVPFIAKDNFLTLGSTTTAASHMLEHFHAPFQATAIERLEAEGAIMVAKANLDAYAHGSSTENSAFGPTKNPIDDSRVPGGSSGGSGAAVALHLAPFALGTDTGGSIRLPASFCGVVGLKPTYGLVSRFGVVAMASSTDVIGPITTSVEDAALLLDIMSGKDTLDGTTIDRDAVSYVELDKSLKGKKVGYIKEYLSEDLAPEIKNIVEATIQKAKDQGATIKEISLPSLDLALACYYIIVPAEVSSNLSRYDGQRYGLSASEAEDLDASYKLSREFGFEAENKRRIMIGTYVLSSGYYDAYYKKAQTVRTMLIQEFKNAFKDVDYLIGPTAPMTAFKLGENSTDPLQMYLADIMTVAANLVGIPAISIPAGTIDGLPIGIQIMSDQTNDRSLLGFAAGLEGIIK